jgi:hypothetical protein
MSGCILLPELPKAAYLSSDAFKAALTPPTARPPATRLNTARRLGSSISLAIWAQKKLWHFSRLHWILWRNCGKSQNSMLHHATHVTHIVRQHNLTKWNAIQLPCHDTLFRGAFSCYVHERPSNLESLEHTFPRTRPINERTGKSLQQSEFETVWIQKANKVTSYGI